VYGYWREGKIKWENETKSKKYELNTLNLLIIYFFPFIFYWFWVIKISNLKIHDKWLKSFFSLWFNFGIDTILHEKFSNNINFFFNILWKIFLIYFSLSLILINSPSNPFIISKCNRISIPKKLNNSIT
jgi:hypothetical protein